VKNPDALKKSLSTNPEYLKNKATESGNVVDYKDWQIVLSRRFRSLKLWLVLRSYGVDNLRGFIRSHVKMAKLFEELVTGDDRFEVAVPRNFATVCFRVLPNKKSKLCSNDNEEGANELTRKLLESINASGDVHMTHSVVGGVYIIRFCVGASLTEDRHVVYAWKVVLENLAAILATDGEYISTTHKMQFC